MSNQSFRQLGVSAPVAATLAARSINHPFNIQKLVLPDALQGLDVLVRSPTGSGKTLAFALPIVERTSAGDGRPSALVLVPTRELAELEGPKRAAMVEAIASARSFGDLSENFEYHAAKNEQGLLERRIRLLRDRLDRAVLVDESAAAAGFVVVGSKVEVEDDQGATMEFEISSVGGVSPDSPVGQALMGGKAGDEVEIQAPKGAWRARIVSVS